MGHILVNTLITTLWELARKPPLGHTQTYEPRKLKDNKCVFKVTKVLVICYSSSRKLIQNIFNLINTTHTQENHAMKLKHVTLFDAGSVKRSVSHWDVSNSLQLHGLQHTRLPCPSPTPGACSDSCPSSQWCHSTISFCHPLLLLPSIFPSIRVFINESVFCIRWPKYWSFSFSH